MHFNVCSVCMQFYLGREGACEDGSVIGDVILPAWADSSHEFIHMHREVYTRTYMYLHAYTYQYVSLGSVQCEPV